MQIVDILRNKKEISGKLTLQPGKRMVRWIGFNIGESRAPRIIKAKHEVWVARKALRGRNIFD